MSKKVNHSRLCPVLWICLLWSAAEAPAGIVDAEKDGRPNIVVILADDMGFSDLGCYGSEIETPNLDGLAAGGLRFTQFYNTARCCPTRAALLTGLYQHQAGMGMMTGNQKTPSYQGYLNDRCATIAEVLRKNGYATLMAGKWHVGKKKPHWPLDRGFDRYFGLISGACSYWEVLKGRKMALDDQPWMPDPEDRSFYMTDAFTNHAIRFLKDHAGKERPFFLYLAYTAPHWPLHAWPEDIARYRGKYRGGWDELRRTRHRRMIEMGIVEKRWPLSPRHERCLPWEDVKDREIEDLRMAIYAAMIDRMDRNIGRLMEQIKEMGAAENTLVLFLSDNGACHTTPKKGDPGAPLGAKGSYPSYGYPWANAGNTPFRMFKQWVHEGGIATPLICHWPGGIRARGALSDQPGHVIDVMPTCLEAAGVRYPKELDGRELLPLEGKSLVPVFRGGKLREPRTLYWEHMGNKAVRRGEWKLVAPKETNRWELYNMKEDRTELHDLSGARPEKARELEKLWNDWSKRVGVRVRGQAGKKKNRSK